MRSKEDLNTTVQLSNVHLAPGDAFLVYDGDKMLLANFTARLVARQILVGFQQNTTFVFIPREVKSQSSWMVNYDTKECDVNIENSWTTSFSSPTYVKESSKLPLQCTYTVTSFQPADYIAAAALTAFSLTGDSSLEVYGVQGNSNKTSKLKVSWS
ncbi:hypothetical protein PoB_002515500 [Plakobranchus ocellatus]|uniref:CUB domain-containing protein n=1 Tax=Plakobranchus ocellatus TaxID=259542 RepID=A0AAV3ZVK1_9GAST|nr:hypothetical protein PoB_002515500 [Plakobranchus ocellatus]